MTKLPDDKKVIPVELQIQVPEKVRAGVYANVVNAGVGKGEVTLNFIYANPNDNPQGTLVSRVIVTRETAKEIAVLLKEVMSTADEVNPQ